MSEHPRDEEELQAFLAGDSALSHHYKESSGEQPPAHIDSAILAASRWAVGADKIRTGQSRAAPVWRRRRFIQWSVPLAMAAVVVLAVALILTIERDPELDRIYQRHDVAVTETRDLDQEPEVVAMAPQAEEEKPAPLKQEATVSAPGKAIKPQVVTEQEASASKEKVASGQIATPSVGRDEIATRTEAGASASMADMARPQEALEEAPAAAPSFAKRQRAGDVGPAGSTAAQTANAPTPAFELETDAPESADAEPPAVDEMASVPEVAPADQQDVANRMAPAGPEDAETPAEPAALVAPAPAQGQRDPEEWIADIEEQLDRGNVELVRAAVKKFHSRYPDYTLPDRLAELLPEAEQ